MNRPRSVELAVKLLWVSFLAGLLRLVFLPVSSDLVSETVLHACSLTLVAVFIFKISQGRNWARTISTGLYLAGLFVSIPSQISFLNHNPVIGIAGLIQIAVQGYAFFLLFSKASNPWFKPVDLRPANLS